jgi:hypothetical protein
MDEAEGPDARLHALLDKQGQELVKGVIEEFASLNREIAALRRELAALTAYQASRDRWLAIETEQAKIAALPRVVTIEPDQMLGFQDGFFPVEHTADGTPFRWTGPSPHFSFDIFIDRSRDVEVRLDVLNCIDFDVQKNLSLLADGESVAVTLNGAAPGFTATAILPQREGKEGTNLVFMLPATIVPPGTQETRALGVAFGRLTAVAGIAESPGTEAHAAAASGADERLAVAQA